MPLTLKEQHKLDEIRGKRRLPEYRGAFLRYCARGANVIERSDLDLLDEQVEAFEEQRAITETSGAAGGYLAPESWTDKVFTQMKTLGLLARCRWWPAIQKLHPPYVKTGFTPIPKVQGFPTEVTLADSTPAFDLPNFATAVAPARRVLQLKSVPVLSICSTELFEDSEEGPAVEDAVITQMAEDLAAWLEERVVTGVGDMAPVADDTATDPIGVSQTCVNESQTVTNAANAWTTANFGTMISKLNKGHLSRAIWLVSPTSYANQTQATQQLFSSAGGPWMNGLPYVWCGYMPAGTVADQVPVVLVDLSQYLIAYSRSGFSVQRLSERYADTNQIGLLARIRVDGALIQPKAACALVR